MVNIEDKSNRFHLNKINSLKLTFSRNKKNVWKSVSLTTKSTS